MKHKGMPTQRLKEKRVEEGMREGDREKGREREHTHVGECIYFCFIDYAKAFDCVDLHKLGKFFKRWEYQTT